MSLLTISSVGSDDAIAPLCNRNSHAAALWNAPATQGYFALARIVVLTAVLTACGMLIILASLQCYWKCKRRQRLKNASCQTEARPFPRLAERGRKFHLSASRGRIHICSTCRGRNNSLVKPTTEIEFCKHCLSDYY